MELVRQTACRLATVAADATAAQPHAVWAKIKDSLAHMLPPKPIATKGGNHAI